MNYIETGIDWCPKVPDHWTEYLFKNCVNIQNGRDYKDIESSNGIPVIGSGGQFAYCTQTMYDGEVVFMGRKGTIDRPLYYNGPFWAVDTMFYAIPNKGFSAKFLYYLAVCFPYKKIYTQTALPSMTQMALRNLRVYIPSYAEQQRMVDYLDAKLSEIDNQVSLLTRKRDAYIRLKKSIINNAVTKGLNPDVKMKDSGIDWCPKVPDFWQEYLFKKCVIIQNGRDYKDIESSDGIPVIGSGGQFAYCTQTMYDGEVVFMGRKGTIDRPLYYNGPFWAVDTMFYTIPNKGFSAKYLYYLAICFPYKKIYTQTALPSMTQMALKNLRVYIPGYAEQLRIVDYLDDKCSKIDTIVENLEKQISRFADLKRALIDEVITGRRVV